MITLGVVSDTHIPDRARSLDPQIGAIFREAGVQAILHAGDVSIPQVLEQLAEIAPVYAVRGNRDWVMLRSLPPVRRLEFGGVDITLTHGHGGWRRYAIDRVYYILHGEAPDHFMPRLRATYPSARVIVFGHTHRQVNQWKNGQLLFNPGSPHFPDPVGTLPSIGLLHIDAAGEVRGEIVPFGRSTTLSSQE